MIFIASVDSYNNCFGKLVAPPASYTSNITGLEVDMLGYESVTFFVFTGTVTDGTWTAQLQDSDESGGGFVNVVEPFRVGDLPVYTAANDGDVFRVGYVGNKRYVTLNILLSTTGTSVVTVMALLGDPRLGPTPENE